MFICKDMPTQEYLEGLYFYKDGKLFYRYREISRGRQSVKGGKEVSTYLDGCGYLRMVLDRKTWPVHRMIWQLVYGDLLPSDTIDHLDRDKVNNEIFNLRKATHKEQSRNKGIPKNNESGFVGVCRNVKKFTTKVGVQQVEYFVARWYDDEGVLKGKHFRIDKLGEDVAFQLASEYRQIKIQELGYLDTHGT